MFRERLNELRAQVPGAEAVCLVAGDGIAVETVGGDGLDLEVLAAELVAMARSISSEQRGLDVGEAERFEFETDRYSVLVIRMQADYYLLIVSEAGQLPGKARFAARRSALSFEDELV